MNSLQAVLFTIFLSIFIAMGFFSYTKERDVKCIEDISNNRQKQVDEIIKIFNAGEIVYYERNGFKVVISKETGWNVDESKKSFYKNGLVIDIIKIKNIA